MTLVQRDTARSLDAEGLQYLQSLAKDGYAAVQHRYQKPGHYLVRVERRDRHDRRAISHVRISVGRSLKMPEK